MQSCLVELSLPLGFGISPQELVDLGVLAEQQGLHGVACGELVSTEAMALLGALSQRTATIRLSSSVVSVLSRSPSLLSMAAVTLANLSRGRFSLGIGAGSPAVAAFHGTTFEAPLSRVERAMADIRTAMSGGRLKDYGGFQLRGVDPVTVPVHVSAMGPEMFRLAAQAADGVVCNFSGPSQIRDTCEILNATRSAYGPASPLEVLTTVWVDAGSDEDEARRRFALELAPYLAVPTYRRAAIALSDEESIDRVQDVWQRQGREAAAELFPQSITDALLLCGSPIQIRQRLVALASAGCTGVRCTPLSRGDQPLAGAIDAVKLLGSVVGDSY